MNKHSTYCHKYVFLQHSANKENIPLFAYKGSMNFVTYLLKFQYKVVKKLST